MPGSTLKYIKEQIRQGKTGDVNFLKRVIYFFELQIPAGVPLVGGQSFFFPLVIPPKAISMDEPFSAEITRTQGSGLYVEENGILERMIRIQGNTGFKPRHIRYYGPQLGMMPWAGSPDRSHNRTLPMRIVDALSGQRHFHYLQDAVFRTYGDLKRDPATSEGTRLIFHNPKDSESWLVIPQKFSLALDSASRGFLYNYTIEMTAVAPATQVDKDFSEDRGILDQIKDALRRVQQGVDMGTGALNDLTRMMADVKNTIRGVATIMGSATTCMNAATAFVNGTTDFIELPYAFLDETTRQVEAAIGFVAAGEELEDTVQGYKASKMPDYVKQKFRTLQDSLEILGTHPDKWETDSQATMRKLREMQSQKARWDLLRKGMINAANAMAGAEYTGGTYDTLPQPTSYDEVEAMGTGPSQGDVDSMDGEVTAGGEINPYQSYRLIPVEDGDTLLSLAAKYLGDIRLWVYIAIANGLKPPFIDRIAAAPLTDAEVDEPPFGEALGVGDMIKIPSYSRSVLNFPILPVLGAHLDEPAENQFLGTDWMLTPVNPAGAQSDMIYDVPINVGQGSLDAMTVSGVANLTQSILIRLSVEQGTNLLYTKLGLRRIVGMNFPVVDLEMAKFMIVEALAADPRIAAIQNVTFAQVDDRFETDLEAVIRGFAAPRPISLTV